MKAIVIKKFKDKEENLIREVGNVIEVTEERFKEINKTDRFLLDLDEILNSIETESIETERIVDNYDDYKVDELKKELDLRQIPYTDEKKAELIEILKIDDADK